MRSQFRFHFKRSDVQVEGIWGKSIFSFDANVLLHLYRYSPETRRELIEIIDKISKNLWLPEQAAYEYLKNRPTVISEQITNLDAARKEVCDSKSKLTDQLKNKNTRSHPYYSKIAKEKYEDGTRALLKELDNNLSEIKKLYNDDPTKEKIADWFEGRTGGAFIQDDFNKHCETGEERYSKKTPPGYADAKAKTKKDSLAEKRSRYGDWFIWRQLMDHAKSEKMDVIFVTDDAKEDWWLQRGDGEIFTPRPELIEEFYEETGQHVLIYSFLKFLKHGRTHLKFAVSSEADDETKTFNLDQVAKSAASRLAAKSLNKFLKGEFSRRASEEDNISTLKDHEINDQFKNNRNVEQLENSLNEIRRKTRGTIEALRDAEIRYEVLTGENPDRYRALSSKEWTKEKGRAASEMEGTKNILFHLNREEVELMHLLGKLRSHR